MPPSSLHRPLFHAPKRRRRADGAKHRARARTPREPAPAGEAPLVDLHVFLYSGVVRDLDPDFFGSNSGDSDAACQMTVEPADSSLDVKEVRLSDILLNSNEPDFKMFFEFGCHEVDSIFTMVCYDWDPQQPVVRAASWIPLRWHPRLSRRVDGVGRRPYAVAATLLTPSSCRVDGVRPVVS